MLLKTREPCRGIIDFIASHKNAVAPVPLGLVAVVIISAGTADIKRMSFDRDVTPHSVREGFCMARPPVAIHAQTGGLPATLAAFDGPPHTGEPGATHRSVKLWGATDRSVKLWHEVAGSHDVLGAAFGSPALGIPNPRRKRPRKPLTAMSMRPLQFQIRMWRAVAAPVPALPTLDVAATTAALSPLAVPAVTAPPPLDAIGPENRRAALLGIAADTMRFDDRPGRISTAAETGTLNGQPAAAMGLGYTLPDGSARLNATGVRSIMAGQKTFGVSAVASLALN